MYPISKPIFLGIMGFMLACLAIPGAVALAWQPAAAATCPPPEPPSSFWGAITVDGGAAPAGMSLTAWIDGTRVGIATTESSGGATYYLVDVPERASDSGTGAVCRQGGAAGETVYLALCGVLRADQQAAWNGGSLARLDLTASGACSDPAPLPVAPAVTIRRSQADPNDIELTWPPVVVDTNGHTLAVVRYDVWRSTTPYFNPLAAPPHGVVYGGNPVTYLDDGALAGGSNTFYVVKAVSVIGHVSAASGRVGAFSFAIVPGH